MTLAVPSELPPSTPLDSNVLEAIDDEACENDGSLLNAMPPLISVSSGGSEEADRGANSSAAEADLGGAAAEPFCTNADAELREVLHQQRVRVESWTNSFESKPVLSQADASYLSTADWLLQVEQEAQDPTSTSSTPPPEEDDAGAVALDDAGSAAIGDDDLSKAREAGMLLDAAEGQLDDEDAAEARLSAHQAERLFVQLEDWPRVVDALRVVARAGRIDGRPQDALQIARERREAFKAAGHRHGEAAMLLVTAESHLARDRMSVGHEAVACAGQPDDALRFARKAAKVAEEAGDRSLQALALLTQAFAQLGNCNADEASQVAREALRLVRGRGDASMEARARHAMAEAHYAAGRYPEAKVQAKDAAKLFGECNCDRDAALQVLLLSDAHLALEENQQAVNCSKVALDRFAALNDAKGRVVALPRVVQALVAAGEPRDALALAESSLATCRGAGDGRGEIAALRACAAAQLGDRDDPGAVGKAVGSAQDALALCKYLGDPQLEADVRLRLAEFQVLEGDFASSAACLSRASRLFQDLGDLGGQGRALLASARIRKRTDDLRGALGEAKDAKSLLEGAGDRRQAASALSLISDAHRRLGEHERAEAAANMARETCEALGDKAGVAGAWLDIAAARLEGGEDAGALRAAKQAQTEVQNPKSRQERKVMEDALHWMASVHFQSDEPAEALKVAKKGESLLRRKRNSTDHEKAGMKLLSAQAKLELLWRLGEEEEISNGAESKKVRKEFEGAVRTAELSVRLARPVDDDHLLASSLHTLGHVYWFGGRYQDSLQVAEEASSLLAETGDPDLELRNLVLLAQAQDATGGKEFAGESLLRARALAEEVGSEAAVEEITTLQEQMKLPAGPAAPQKPALGERVE